MNFEKIYNDNFAKIFGFIKTRIKNVQDAEELAQNVFVNASKSLERFDGERASVSTWLYTIAKNIVVDYYRIKKVQKVSITDEHPKDEEGVTFSHYTVDVIDNNDPHNEIVRKENAVVYGKAFKKLPKSCRRVANLFFNHNKSLKEIGVIAKIDNINTIKSKISSARKILKEELANI